MDFLSQLLRGIAFVPALVNGIEAIFGGRDLRDVSQSSLNIRNSEGT